MRKSVTNPPLTAFGGTPSGSRGVDRVLVDGQPVAQGERVEGNGVRFVVPVHEAGTVEVTVCAGDQCISRVKGLKYVAPILPGQ